MSTGNVGGNPNLIKTFGWLNIIFGGLLMVCMPCGSLYMVMIPDMLKWSQGLQEQAMRAQEVRREAALTELRKELGTAEDEQKKAEIRSRIIEVEGESAPVAVTGVDPGMIEAFASPVVRGHFLIDAATGVLVNLALLISGIGLVKLKPWAFALARGTAIVKILRIVLLAASSLFLVSPAMYEGLGRADDARKAKVEAEAKARPPGEPAPPAAPSMSDAIRSMRSFSYVSSVVWIVFACAYPILLLVFVKQPAKALTNGDVDLMSPSPS